MWTTHSAPCLQQDAGLAAHPLCAMQSAVEGLASRRPFSYSKPGASVDGIQASFSYTLNRGRHSPKHTNPTRSL